MDSCNQDFSCRSIDLALPFFAHVISRSLRAVCVPRGGDQSTDKGFGALPGRSRWPFPLAEDEDLRRVFRRVASRNRDAKLSKSSDFDAWRMSEPAAELQEISPTHLLASPGTEVVNGLEIDILGAIPVLSSGKRGLRFGCRLENSEDRLNYSNTLLFQRDRTALGGVCRRSFRRT